jgi:hypothetical protein
MPKAEWKGNRYGGSELALGRLVVCYVYYQGDQGSDGRPWRVAVGHAHLPAVFATAEEAKAAAEKVARELITEAMEALP